jgi:hypothetical protein
MCASHTDSAGSTYESCERFWTLEYWRYCFRAVSNATVFGSPSPPPGGRRPPLVARPASALCIVHCALNLLDNPAAPPEHGRPCSSCCCSARAPWSSAKSCSSASTRSSCTSAALLVTLLTPGASLNRQHAPAASRSSTRGACTHAGKRICRRSFGRTCGQIGLLIAMASDHRHRAARKRRGRSHRAFPLRVLGPWRAPAAFLGRSRSC